MRCSADHYGQQPGVQVSGYRFTRPPSKNGADGEEPPRSHTTSRLGRKVHGTGKRPAASLQVTCQQVGERAVREHDGPLNGIARPAGVVQRRLQMTPCLLPPAQAQGAGPAKTLEAVVIEAALNLPGSPRQVAFSATQRVESPLRVALPRVHLGFDGECAGSYALASALQRGADRLVSKAF